MILFRWHTVNGCIEWLRISTSRYVGPAVHGLPRLGPCTRAAAFGLPLLVGPMLPGLGAVGSDYPYGYWPSGDYAGAPAFGYAGGETTSPRAAISSPWSPAYGGSGTAALAEDTGLVSRVAVGESPTPLSATAGASAASPAPAAVPEPPSVAVLAVGVAAAITVRRRA